MDGASLPRIPGWLLRDQPERTQKDWTRIVAAPESSQQALFHGIIEHQHEIRRQVEKSIFPKYQTAVEQWRKDMADVSRIMPDFAATSREFLSDLRTPNQIWPLLSDGNFEMEDQPGCFSIYWNCEWDLEHGVRATFVDWALKVDDEC